MFCDGVQADIGGDMLIDDLHTSIMQQAAFDAVVRVRTSTGKSLSCMMLWLWHLNFWSAWHMFLLFCHPVTCQSTEGITH